MKNKYITKPENPKIPETYQKNRKSTNSTKIFENQKIRKPENFGEISENHKIRKSENPRFSRLRGICNFNLKFKFFWLKTLRHQILTMYFVIKSLQKWSQTSNSVRKLIGWLRKMLIFRGPKN